MPHRRAAEIRFFALLDGPDIDDALAAARARFADEAIWSGLEVTVRHRATDGGRFDAAVRGQSGAALEARSDHERWLVTRCQRYATISATLPDPATLEVLHAAETVAHALAVDGELTLLLDEGVARWFSVEEVLQRPPDRAFDPDEHFLIVVEAVERLPGAGHVVRTRGLEKFARPDLFTRVPRSRAEQAAEPLRALARRMAEGESVPGDGDLVEVRV